jgi:toxin ParE1/3/4
MRSRRLTYTDEAIADIRRLQFYIALDNPARARSYIAELRVYVQNAAESGLTGTARPDFGPNLRTLVFGRQHIILVVTDTDLVILHITDAARNIPALLNDGTHT